MSWLDELKATGSDLLTAGADTIAGGATDWLSDKVSGWSQSGQEVGARPETIRPEASPAPDSGEVKQQQQQVAAMAGNLGQWGVIALALAGALVLYKAVK